MVVWRLLPFIRVNGYLQMAIDESILTHRCEGKVPNTVRFYQFYPSAVTIGYFQSIFEEVYLDYCSSNGIDVVRRITGGGAVFHDENGEITYSVVAGVNDVPRDIVECYGYICNGLIYALERFGLKGEFKPLNDVVVYGRKISGSAQTRRREAILQHGTFMYSTNMYELVNSLKIVPEKLRDKGVQTMEERVVTISKALGRTVSRDEALKSLIYGFEKAFNCRFEVSELTESEWKLAEKLAKEKYSVREWNYMV
ncbi:MAG: biotin/lipoate A/B protein ligase family protein [Candidatus Methanomethylicia archaeon]